MAQNGSKWPKMGLKIIFEKKPSPYRGGVVPRGDCMGGVSPPWGGLGGGCRARKKKFPKKSQFFFGPNRVINSICACFRKSFFFESIFYLNNIYFALQGGV